MVWIRTLLTIMTADKDNMTHSSMLEVNSSYCPANIAANYTLCTTTDCRQKVKFDMYPIEVTPEMCSKGDAICVSPECLHSAARFIEHMDKNYSPCTDFYNYACGMFVKNTKIPQDEEVKSTYTNILDEQTEEIIALLAEPFVKQDIRPFLLAKNFFQACMSSDKTKESSEDKLLELLTQFIGWPVLEVFNKFSEATFKLEESLYLIRGAGYSADYVMTISYGLVDEIGPVIRVRPPSMGAESSFLFRGQQNADVQEYIRYMKTIALELGDLVPDADKMFSELIEFEVALAHITKKANDAQTPSNQRQYYTQQEMTSIFPSFNWYKTVDQFMLRQVDFSKAKYDADVSFLRDLTGLLEKTPSRAIANYIMWRVVKDTVEYLPSRFMDIKKEYEKNIRIVVEDQEHRCAALTKSKFPVATRGMFVTKYFHSNWKFDIIEMVSDIRHQLEVALQTSRIITDDYFRKAMMDNLKRINITIAFPYELLKSNKLVDMYSTMQDIDPEHYLDAALKLSLHQSVFIYKKLQQPRASDALCEMFNMYLEPSDSFWSCYYTRADIDAMLVKGPWFSTEQPDYLHYGSLGPLIATKLPQKLNYLLMTNEVEEKEQCFRMQYVNYLYLGADLAKVKDVTRDVINTMIGIQLSYKAYVEWTQRHKEAQKLPGMQEFTSRQMFWLSAAESFCSVYSAHHDSLEVAPARALINLAMINLKEFSKDFKCPNWSELNTKSRCHWFY